MKRGYNLADYLEKIRILREADRGERSVADICREENFSEVSFHRLKRQFGHMEIQEAWRLKELEREMQGTERQRLLEALQKELESRSKRTDA